VDRTVDVCPLCEALKSEPKIYEDRSVAVLPPKARKGHGFRLMVVAKDHAKTVPHWLEDYMVEKLTNIGLSNCNGTKKFVIMTPMFGNVPEHAHFIASDLSKDAEDFDQVMGTPWIKVVEVKPWNFPSL
jgi:hypothetical protein